MTARWALRKPLGTLLRFSLEPNVERCSGLVDVWQLIGDNLELLLQLVRRRSLPQLDSLHECVRKTPAEEVHRVHLDVRVANGDQVRHRLELQLVLNLQESMHLPRVAVAGKGGFKGAARGDNVDLSAAASAEEECE